LERLREKDPMLRITRAQNATVVFRVSGRLNSENLSEFKKLISAEAKGQSLTFDLSELTLVDEEAVRFLDTCEANGIELTNCPAYVREWITRERRGS
jgi:anti-anti-sigma regulatory factor